MADDLRVPVSNLVRNVLEEAFSVVESVTENVGDLLDDVIEEASQARERRRDQTGERASRNDPEPVERTEYPNVLAWQQLILNRDQRCGDCNDELERGSRAFVGMLESGGFGSVWLCRDCMEERH